MASADELIREAEYAFRNISQGSTRARKYTAKAKKYAKRVVRQYPNSIEAAQARLILDRLEVSYESVKPVPTQQTTEFLQNHASTHEHFVKPVRARNDSVADEEWRDILQRFLALAPFKKKILLAGAIFTFFVPGLIFVVLFAVVILFATRPDLLKKYVLMLLTTLE